jgi:signal recognition particle subunit SRP54
MMGAGGGDMARLKAMGGGRMPSPDDLAKLGGQLPGLGGGSADGAPKLPGLGGAPPPGFNPFKKS